MFSFSPGVSAIATAVICLKKKNGGEDPKRVYCVVALFVSILTIYIYMHENYQPSDLYLDAGRASGGGIGAYAPHIRRTRTVYI